MWWRLKTLNDLGWNILNIGKKISFYEKQINGLKIKSNFYAIIHMGSFLISDQLLVTSINLPPRQLLLQILWPGYVYVHVCCVCVWEQIGEIYKKIKGSFTKFRKKCNEYSSLSER